MGTRIESLEEYVKVIDDYAKNKHCDLVRNDQLLFRGQADVSYPLLPGIAREKTWYRQSLTWFEKEMVENAIGKRPDIFGNEQYPIDLLTKLQHYGLPTRLLDVTYNAFVALYFACQEKKDEDSNGEVIVFHVSSDEQQWMYYYNNGLVNAIAQMYKIGKLSEVSRRRFFEIADLSGYDEIKLTRLQLANDDAFESQIAEWISKPLFVSPANLSERQKRQQGAFIIFPNEYRRTEEPAPFFSSTIKEMVKADKPVLSCIEIPKEKKQELISQLGNFGITKEFLFPDSLDILCKSITENALSRMK